MDKSERPAAMLLGRRQNHSERPIFLKVLALEGTPAKKIIALNQWANKNS